MESSHAMPPGAGAARGPSSSVPRKDVPSPPAAPPSAAPTGVLAAAAALAGALTWALGRRASAVAAEWLGWASAGASVHAVRVEDAVSLGALVVAAGVSGWFALGLAVAAGCAAARTAGGAWLAGERLVAGHAPALVRRALAISTGTGLALAGAAGAATAVTPEPPVDLGWTVTSEAPPDAGPPPDTAPAVVPTGAAVEATAPSGGAAPAAATTPDVTVRPGDTLWAIARAHLPAGATTADVATAWPAWYAANAAVIGSDPDLVLPGQRLVAPSPSASTGSAASPGSATSTGTGTDR